MTVEHLILCKKAEDRRVRLELVIENVQEGSLFFEEDMSFF